MLRFLARTGFRRGFLGGSRAWTMIGAVAVGMRLLKRLTASEPEVVFSQPIRPGEKLLVSVDGPSRAVPSRP